jgi:hypothetical protein
MEVDSPSEEDAGMSQSDVIAWLQEHPGRLIRTRGASVRPGVRRKRSTIDRM